MSAITGRGITFPAAVEDRSVMDMLSEAHVLARYAERVARAEATRRRTRLVDAIRAQRRAERATARARRLKMLAGME